MTFDPSAKLTAELLLTGKPDGADHLGCHWKLECPVGCTVFRDSWELRVDATSDGSWCFSIAYLSLAFITTLGELAALYERFTGQQWPGKGE